MDSNTGELKIGSITFNDNQTFQLKAAHRKIMETAKKNKLILIQEKDGVGTLVKPAEIIIRAERNGQKVEIRNAEIKRELQVFYAGFKFNSKLVEQLKADIDAGRVKITYSSVWGYKIVKTE